jgi:threonine aldolase
MKVIDLRSDTVTQPTAPMREAMMAAEVGDDVYGEDPTVNLLQERGAELLGKESTLFFPSGTMANQTAIHSLTRRGDVVLASQNCHILKYEAGAASALSGLQIKTIGAEGIFDASDVRENMHPDEQHFAPTTVVAVENTHNMAGGRIFPADLLEEVVKVARDAGLRLHLDGARLFNAAVASGTDPARLAEPFDTVSICLSKGLGAPVGSLVGASFERIHQLRRIRKMFGGGMRQAGFLAAAGIHALEHHVERLAEDHANARFLAEGLERLGLAVRGTPETNMVNFDFEDTLALVRGTRARHLLINPTAPGRFRAVTHLDVSSSDLEEALERLGAVLEEIRS